jgi:hypothetical protein
LNLNVNLCPYCEGSGNKMLNLAAMLAVQPAAAGR